MPVLIAPRIVSEDGSTITDEIEFDFTLLLKAQPGPDEQGALLKSLLGPWNNYFVAHYSAQLRELALFSRNAFSTFSGQELKLEQLHPAPEEKFDDAIAKIHEGFADYLPLWEQLDSSMRGDTVNNPLLAIAGSDRQVSLSAVLQLVGVTDRAKVAEAGNQLMSTQVGELQQRILPCLGLIAWGSSQALALLDRKNSP